MATSRSSRAARSCCHLGERSGADAGRSARPQRGHGMAVRGAQFGRDGEPALVPVEVLRRHGDTPAWKLFDEFLKIRLEHWSRCWQDANGWPGPSPVADILMADVLRLVDRFDGLAGYPACRDYVARATARPAFVKAHADQMAHFAAADGKRSGNRRIPASQEDDYPSLTHSTGCNRYAAVASLCNPTSKSGDRKPSPRSWYWLLPDW